MKVSRKAAPARVRGSLIIVGMTQMPVPSLLPSCFDLIVAVGQARLRLKHVAVKRDPSHQAAPSVELTLGRNPLVSNCGGSS